MGKRNTGSYLLSEVTPRKRYFTSYWGGGQEDKDHTLNFSYKLHRWMFKLPRIKNLNLFSDS